jgi:hypothetical protein
MLLALFIKMIDPCSRELLDLRSRKPLDETLPRLLAPEPSFETKRGSLPCPTPSRCRKPCQLSTGAIPCPRRAAANAPKSAFLRLLTDELTLGMRHERAPTFQRVGRGKVHGGNALS